MELCKVDANRRRLYVLPVARSVKAIRWTGHSTWGASDLRVYSIEASSTAMPLSQDPPAGKRWVELISKMPAEDLDEPDHGLEHKGHGASRVGA